MKYFYILKIETENPAAFPSIMKINGVKYKGRFLEYEIVESEDNPPVDFINHFLDILDKFHAELKGGGVVPEDVSIWMLYEYDQQCNMEFLPQQLKRLGEAGITLCVSCWEVGSQIEFGG